jgi:hypothetical protein
MMVVGQHLGETHLMHGVHGNTINEAVRLISTAGVKIQSLGLLRSENQHF